MSLLLWQLKYKKKIQFRNPLLLILSPHPSPSLPGAVSIWLSAWVTLCFICEYWHTYVCSVLYCCHYFYLDHTKTSWQMVKRRKLQLSSHVSRSSVWPEPSCKAQLKGEEDKADRGRGEKTTSGNGQAWSLAGPRKQWRTGKKWRKLVVKSSVMPQWP